MSEVAKNHKQFSRDAHYRGKFFENKIKWLTDVKAQLLGKQPRASLAEKELKEVQAKLTKATQDPKPDAELISELGIQEIQWNYLLELEKGKYALPSNSQPVDGNPSKVTSLSILSLQKLINQIPNKQTPISDNKEKAKPNRTIDVNNLKSLIQQADLSPLIQETTDKLKLFDQKLARTQQKQFRFLSLNRFGPLLERLGDITRLAEIVIPGLGITGLTIACGFFNKLGCGSNQNSAPVKLDVPEPSLPEPVSASVTPDGRFIFVVGSEGSRGIIWMINPNDLRIEAKIRDPQDFYRVRRSMGFSDIAFSPDSRFAYLIGDNRIWTFDVQKRKFDYGTSIPGTIGKGGYQLSSVQTFASDPDHVYVLGRSDRQADRVWRLDATNFQSFESVDLPGGTTKLQINPNNSILYATGLLVTTEIDLASFDATRSLPDTSSDAIISKNGETFYRLNPFPSTLEISDLSGNAEPRTINLGEDVRISTHKNLLSLSEDGNFVYVATDSSLLAIDTRTDTIAGSVRAPNLISITNTNGNQLFAFSYDRKAGGLISTVDLTSFEITKSLSLAAAK